MAKKAKKLVTKKAPIRRRQSRLEWETRLEKFLIWGVVVVAVLVVGTLGYGLVYEKVVKARRPVAEVDGVPITVAEFLARVGYERLRLQSELERMQSFKQSLDPEAPESQYLLQQIDSSVSNLQFQLSMVDGAAFEQLTREELVRQETERRGIAVTPEELQQEIELYFGYDRNPATPTPVPTATPVLTETEVLTPTPTTAPLPTPTPMTEEAFRQEYSRFLREFLRPIGVSEQQFRSWFEAGLLTERLREWMKEEVPSTAEQVELRYLAVDSEERAKDLAARLDAGEDFQALQDELEADEKPTEYAMDANWYTKDMLEGYYGAEWAEQAFSLEIGEHSGPILGPGLGSQSPSDESSKAYYVIELLDRDEARELPAYLYQQRADEAFQEWLDSQQDKVKRFDYAGLVSAGE